jgi:hypothetical protein
MMRTVAAVGVAALSAIVLTALPELVSVRAVPGQSEQASPQVVASGCPQRGWPYYETVCLRDAEGSGAQGARTGQWQLVRDVPAKPVRIVK